MEVVKSLCKNFVVIQGIQPEIIKAHGFPVDVLPIRNRTIVQEAAQQHRPKLQGFLDCCYRSLMAPMHEATLAMGATTIIRGQKSCDHHKSPVKNGDVIDGVTYWFPIEGWSDDQVMAYIAESSLLPKHYAEARTSMDCMHCTAYLAENQWKLPYLKKHYPAAALEVESRLQIIRREVEKDMAHLYGVL